MSSRVDNTLLREACERLEREGVSYLEQARWCGYLTRNRKEIRGDYCRLMRRLGLQKHNGRFSTALQYDTAVHIVRSLGFDPVDVGV